MHADIVILCAGGSTRLGQAKQHVKLQGKSLLQRARDLGVTYAALHAATARPLIVSGACYERDYALLGKDSDCELLHNPRWQEGMQASISCALEARRSSGALLLLLVDQYRVCLQDLLLLTGHWVRAPLVPVAARYANTIGPPVIWPQRFFAPLATQGQSGKKLLTTVHHQAIAMPHAAIDLDVPADLQSLRDYERGL